MRNAEETQIAKDSLTLWMSRFLIFGLLGSALIVGTGAAWAGGGGHGHKHDPKTKLEWMTKKLDLTKEQQDKILPILQDKHQKMEALHNQMKEVRKNAMSRVEAELTPDQKETFQKLREKRKEKMKEYREKHKKGKGHEKRKHGKDEDHD